MTSSVNIPPQFVLLLILDGWGIAKDGPGNAIFQAATINFDKLWNNYPHGQLQASGEAVGLPRYEDGNTETGHLNLGAGRIIYQDLQRINIAIEDNTFFKNEVLLSAIEHVKKNKSSLHLMGLIGAGGVHSNMKHLSALIKLASDQGIKDVFIHAFTDGRDSPPTTASTYLAQIEAEISENKVGKIASIIGRYWAMDRDQRWDRTERAYLALTSGVGSLQKDLIKAVEASYLEGKTDEFIEPVLATEDGKTAIGQIKDNDAVVFFNFRIDRPRQLTKAFISSNEAMYGSYTPGAQSAGAIKPLGYSFERKVKLQNLFFVTMTDYGKVLTDDGAHPAFPPEVVDFPISGVISASGERQLKITESEKERFLTFYLNGLREAAYAGEDRIIIPSAKVATYDQKPEMEAYKITDLLISKLSEGQYKLVVVNFPNADMVGHTGNIGACVKAVEVIDQCLGRLSNFVLAYNGAMIVTADHGNAEEMINSETGQIDTEHSTYPVPFIAIANSLMGKTQVLTEGKLSDVAPTVLGLLKLAKPVSMNGRDLLSGIK
jgi:2,3-bisphosphoglycerate-independent phosphoglycerate mutase